MILSIPSLINGYEITECTRSDGAGLCETYKGKSKLQKPVIIVAYNMKAIERSSFKAAYFWELSCHQPLFSPSFQPLFDKISIKNKGRNIKIIVFQALPSMMTLVSPSILPAHEPPMMLAITWLCTPPDHA